MTLRGRETQIKSSLGGHPAGSFFLFLAVNTLLSYGPLPPGAKYGVGLLGFLVFAFGLARALKKPAPGEKPPFELELFPKLPGWCLLLPVAFAVFPRLFRLTGLSAWPFTDEGYFSLYSIELMKNWDWKFFFALGQHPPFFNWAFALFFKIVPPSLFSLWLFPALLSVLAVGLAYGALRPSFPKSFAFLGLFVAGFSFWPLYAGRICQPTAALPLWQMLALALLALFVRLRDSKNRWKAALALGIATGLGFYAAIPWAVTALSVGLAVLFIDRAGTRKPQWDYGFWGGSAVFFLPFLFISLHEKNGRYMQALWGIYPGMDVAQQLRDFLSHLQALLWGFNPRRLFGPVWGGFLNPVLGAAFLTGILECLRFRRVPLVPWAFLSLGLLLLPAALARGYDGFRILSVLPFAAFFAVCGLQALLSWLKSTGRIWVTVLLLGTSLGLDGYHLFGRFQQTWGTPGATWDFGKLYELWKAGDILRDTAAKEGPGAVLFELRPHLEDVSTTVACYPFDSAWNGSIPFESARWVAVMTDAGCRPFLAQSFPKGRWYWLGPKKPYGGWMLAVIPIEADNRAVLGKWFAANDALKPSTDRIIDAMPGDPRQAILQDIFKARDRMEGDRFLETCFWGKVFDNAALDGDAPVCLEAASRCLAEGYPLPGMYNEEGVLLARLGRYTEARAAFGKAVRGDEMHLTPAWENLQALPAAKK